MPRLLENKSSWRLSASLLAMVMAVCAPAVAKGQTAPQVPGQVLVQLRSSDALPSLLTRFGLTVSSRFGARPIYRLAAIAPNTDPEKLAASLALQPGVLAAETNAVHANPEAKRLPIFKFGNSVAEVGAQWAPAALRLSEAHALAQGQGVTVAVLDTGIDGTHAEFSGRLVPGHDFVDGDADPSEVGSFTAGVGVYGHGTHVAGVVARTAPGAKIMPLRVLDTQGETNAWVLGEALLMALDRGAQVVNMSLGSLERTRILRTVAQLATCSLDAVELQGAEYSDPGYSDDKSRCTLGGRRLVLAAAAGNYGSDKLRTYPAAERGVYGLVPVAASAQANRLAHFSNSGGWIDIAAPGDAIVSAVPGNGYATWSGTSMATPYVAGALALVLSRYPGLEPADVARRVTETGQGLCGTRLTQLDAAAAVGAVAVASACP